MANEYVDTTAARSIVLWNLIDVSIDFQKYTLTC